jgi:hypothetical protein
MQPIVELVERTADEPPAAAAPEPAPLARAAETRRESEAARVRREAIGIHLAFANMHPLIRRTRHLSLNALLASARLAEEGRPFGIVAQELNTVGGDLEGLIDEIERMFRQLVLSIAHWGKSELNVSYLERSRIAVQRRSEPEHAPGAAGGPAGGADGHSADGPSADGHGSEGRGSEGGGAAGHTLALLLEHTRAMRETIYREIERIDLLAGKLSGRIDRINWVAVRQCHYTSISAQIEAAQVHDDRGGLASVAADIRALADDIASAERLAKERAVRLRHLLKSRLPILKKQVRHD